MDVRGVNQGGVVKFSVQQQSSVVTDKAEIEPNLPLGQADEQYSDEPTLSNESVKQVVDGLNRVMDAFNSELKFVYHEKLKKYYVTIVNSQTNEVVKEIPPKKLLDFFANVNEQLGLIIDHKI